MNNFPSSSGRTSSFEVENSGSNPGGKTNRLREGILAQLRKNHEYLTTPVPGCLAHSCSTALSVDEIGYLIGILESLPQ